MPLSIGAVVIDAKDPMSLARFWADALSYDLRGDDNWSIVIDPKGERIRLCFMPEQEPKVASNRLHFDLYAMDMAEEVERLTGLGARQKRVIREPGNTFTVMQDPEGNEFCVCQCQI